MESLYVNVDEIIIDFVRENHCLYDKRNIDFKNTNKKKDLWKQLSDNLKNLYRVNMSAEGIEKRWSSLRDMFSRENRKHKLQPSGSGYEPIKEWELYRNMLFLTPHITHRRTKTSLVEQNQLQSLPLKSSATNICSPSKNSKQSSNLLISLPYDHNYSGSFQSIEDDKLLNIENDEIIMTTDSEISNRPVSTLSRCSSTSSFQVSEASTSSNPINFKNSFTLKSHKKITPEMDDFAKRRKNKDDQLDRDLAEASKEISAAMKAVSSQMYDQKPCKDGYMFAIEEGLKYIPPRNKTQCLIEVLQIIQKYEERQ